MAEPISATTAMLLLGGANVGMAALKAQQAARQREMEAKIRAAEIEASPWTGRAPSTQISTPSLNPWAEMAGGAINTLGQTAALQQAGLFKAGDVAGSNTAVAGGVDPDLKVGGQQTVFGNIGAEEMSPASKQAANYFSMQSPNMNPFTKPMSGMSSWPTIASNLYGKAD